MRTLLAQQFEQTRQKPTNAMKNDQGPSTLSVHAGEPRLRPSLSVTEPIVTGMVYPFANTKDMIEFLDERKYKGTAGRDEYARNGNPTRRAAEVKLAAMELQGDAGEEELDAVLTSSGMAALAGLLLLSLTTGDHVILGDSIYRVTKLFVADILPKLGIEVTAVYPCDINTIRKALQPNTRLILVESPSNPFNYCVDLHSLAALGREKNITTVVDNTLATPFNSKPLALGIDFVVHSVTKYLAGHNDVLAGVVIGDAWNVSNLRPIQTHLGAVLDPFSSAAILRGLKTFGLRMAQHNANAMALATMLRDHPKVQEVWYAGLEDHPSHAVAIQHMTGYGGVVSLEMEDHEQAARLVDNLQMALISGSLGATETMVHQPWLLSHYDQTPDQREAERISEGLIRVACGIEDTYDLLHDFRQALNKL